MERRGQLFDVYGHEEAFDREQFTMKVAESSKSLFFSQTRQMFPSLPRVCCGLLTLSLEDVGVTGLGIIHHSH